MTTTFLTHLTAIARQNPAYRLGGDGSDGTCDCIGLIIGALKKCGIPWNGTHGSNWAARHAVTGQHSAHDPLSPGEVVFKTHAPGAPGWALPSRYADHPDQADYYHIGVVVSAAPLRILHCTTPGVLQDTSASAWDVAATLTALRQEHTQRTVTAPSGSTVNLRVSPGGALLARIPVGAQVTVTGKDGDWSRLTHEGHIGWMLTEYLTDPAPDRLTLLEQAVTELRERLARLEASA